MIDKKWIQSKIDNSVWTSHTHIVYIFVGSADTANVYVQFIMTSCHNYLKLTRPLTPLAAPLAGSCSCSRLYRDHMISIT